MANHNICVPNEWPMVVITDNNKDYSVFPPINHENLTVFSNHHIPQSQSQSQSPPSSSSSPSFSTSDCDASDTWGDYSSSSSSSLSSPFDSQVRKGGLFTGWLSIGLQILRSKLLSAVSSFRNPSPHRGPIWSFGIPAATVIILVVLLTRRKKNLTPNETRLINIIKEKDGRIAQLLHQIAQMNEILIDRHKALAAKVPP